MDKKIVMIGMAFGSIVGGWIPTLWGAGAFSFVAIMGSLVGGILGIWLSFKLIN